ncbi:DNA adenine methylase [Streptomyces sp. HP-A2021]|uniref:DNA adenine methylase n=1 Tax=Streptomyces sp. HP-A2021 TaxID=2927875 RepID=UPI001FAEBA03|nr:DNA adenine methylase [Streptomyces sp. HP-A2021]UOB09120.1 DNA adenine methylase [Streptomyces sp. HP-A2021]
MKSPVPYFGSKQRIAPWIVSLLPDHDHYVEPYAGGLSVLLAKAPSPMETVNDLDAELVTFWRVLRDRPTELLRACMLTPHSRAELAATWDPTDDDLELARRIWCRLAQGRSGTLRNTGWRHYIDPAGSSTSMPGYLEAYALRLAAGAERLHGVSLEALPALDLIAKYGKQPRVLLYVDPPYLGSTRGWGRNYRHEMKTDAEHRALAAALADCRAAVVLSGYDSPLYLELYADWHRYEQQTMTGNATSDKGRTEVLWSNVQLGSQLDLFTAAASR